MKINNLKTSLQLLIIACTIFSKYIEASESEIPEIFLAVSGMARYSSIVSGYAVLINRTDAYATKLKGHSLPTNQEKAIIEYNKAARKHNDELKIKKLAAAAGLDDHEKHTSHESLEKALKQEQFAFGVPDGHSVSSNVVVTGNSSAVVVSTETVPLNRRRLLAVLKEQAEKIKELEGRTGVQTIGTSAISRTGDKDADLLLMTYHVMLEKLKERATEYLKVKADFEEMKALCDEICKLRKSTSSEAWELEVSVLEKVEPFLERGSLIVGRYGSKVNHKGVASALQKATSDQERMEMLLEYWQNSYMCPVLDRYGELEDSTFLSDARELAIINETYFANLKARKLIAEAVFVKIAGVLLQDKTSFALQIQKNDEQACQEYMKFLKAEEEGLKLVQDFSVLPITLSLFRSPMAFFLLAKRHPNITVVPFEIMDRVSSEIDYLTLDQRKALFAYLYDISLRFQAVTLEYQSNTLLSTAIKVDDAAYLIEEVRKRLKDSNIKTFTPSSTDMGDSTRFCTKVADLVSGRTRRKAIIDGFLSERSILKGKMQGVTREKIEGYHTVNSVATEASIVGSVIGIWDLIQSDDAVGSIDLDLLLSQRNTLMELRKTLDANGPLLARIAVFKVGAVHNTNASMIPLPPPPITADTSFVPPPPPPPSFDDASSATVVVSPFVAQKSKFISVIELLEQQLVDKKSKITDYDDSMNTLLEIKEKAGNASKDQDLIQCELRLSPIKRKVKAAHAK